MHAHQLGVVHRDIKPANLLVDGQGRLWVTDFGLAHCQSQVGLTLTGDLVGTLRYMSPEQALGQPAGVDSRTDLYSLGATLYELLTLEPAFNGCDRQELLRKVGGEEPKPPRRLNRAVPADLETIVLKVMAKSPAERYATARELADDLERFLNDEPIRARRPTPVQQARRWAKGHRVVVWSAAVGLFAALGVLAGSAGWVMRDQAARQAKRAADLQAALDEAQWCQEEGQWPRAEAAARRAEVLLRDGAVDPGLAARVQGLLRGLAEEEADGRMLARLEEIRLLQAEVNAKENRFLLERALPEYRQAFAGYDLGVATTEPDVAAARLLRRPSAVRGALVAALDHWLDLARDAKAPEADWLEQVLSAADTDPWRQRLRSARRGRDCRELERLAREVDVAAQPPQALFVLDRALHAGGVDAGAVPLLRRAQEAFPGDFWSNQNLGTALAQCQPPQLEEAIRFLTAAVALRPQSPGARLNLGLVLWEKGRLDEAAAAFRQAAALKPDYADAHSGLAVILWKKGRLDEALAACRQAIALKPDSGVAHYNLGLVLAEKGRLDEAVAAYRQATRCDPDDAVAHNNLGVALADLGRLDEAIAAYHKGIERKRDYAEAYNNLGFALWKQGRSDEAVAVLRKAIELKPDLSQAHFNLGNALAGTGQLDERVSAYRKAIDLRLDHAEAHCNLGNALARKGQLDEAMTAYRRAIELEPDLAEAHFNSGLTLTRLGRLDDAIMALRKAVDLRPAWANAHYDLGNALQSRGRLDEAVAAYRRSIELRPDSAEAYCNLGNALRQLREFRQALAALKRGHELGSRRPYWPYPSHRWVQECQRLVESTPGRK
jgi:tetratricopeptide (TPR) repeat protein